MDFDFKKSVEEYLVHLSEVEGYVKEAERIRNQTVIPAINELRYAGRYMSEIYLALISGVHSDNSDDVKVVIRDKLRDANFSCLKAKHDVMDAVRGQLHADYMVLRKEFTPSVVRKTLPKHDDMLALGKEIDRCQTDSRKDRDNIDEHYGDMFKNYYPKVLEYLSLMSDPLTIESLHSECKSNRRKSLYTAAGIFLAALGLLVGVAQLLKGP
ncbi:hypothetical protein [Kordiimonas pumila]|uniref:Uncharacterized protein n=1 Tax=Kordiimonas pumila TaxID=2161677 RepID=A0ABV7D8E6_9PROT|nr:hypothetical protein [Kordiimonas pumila]